MPSVFPIEFEPKQNSPELLAFMQAFGPSLYLDANEINLIFNALNELHSSVGSGGGTGISNGLIGDWPVYRSGIECTIPSGRQWVYSGTIFTNDDEFVASFPYAASGKKRFDLIVAKNDGTIERVIGEETDLSSPSSLPTVPSGAIFVTFIYATSLTLLVNPPTQGQDWQQVMDNGRTYTATAGSPAYTVNIDLFKNYPGVGYGSDHSIVVPQGDWDWTHAFRIVPGVIFLFSSRSNAATGAVENIALGPNITDDDRWGIASGEVSSDVDEPGSVGVTLGKPDYGQVGNYHLPAIDGDKDIATTDDLDGYLSAAEDYADGLFDTLVGASPADLDTLQEISAALQNNPDIIAELFTSLGNRLRFDVNNQGLSSIEKANALTNLGIVIADLLNRANHTGSQAISTITGLQSALDGKMSSYVFNQKQIVAAAYEAASPTVISGRAYSVTGATSRAFDDTNFITRLARLGIVTTATSGNVALMRQTITYFSMNALNDKWMVFTMSDGATNSGVRFFAGWSDLIGVQSNVEPNTLTNIVGVSRPSGSNNLHIIRNDASGAAIESDLGSGYPANTNKTDLYLVRKKNLTASSVRVTVYRFNTSGALVSSTYLDITTDLPAPSVNLANRAWISNNGNAAACGFDFVVEEMNSLSIAI